MIQVQAANMVYNVVSQGRLASSNRVEFTSKHVTVGDVISRQHDRVQLDGHLIEQVQTPTIYLSRLAVY